MPVRALIVTSNSDLIDRLASEAERQQRTPPLSAMTYDQAVDVFQRNRNGISAIAVSSGLEREALQNLVFACLRAVPNLIVMLIDDGQLRNNSMDLTPNELFQMKIVAILEPSVTLQKINSEIGGARLSERVVGGSLDPNFSPISPESISASESSVEDVYLRIRADRYVKVLHKGYALGSNRLENYLERGLRSLYQTKKAN